MLKVIVLLVDRDPGSLKELRKEAMCHGAEIFVGLPDEELLLKDTLFITDNEKIAKEIMRQRGSLLVWYHDDNRRQKFQVPYGVERLNEVDFAYLEKIYRRFHGLPWYIAETKRCYIREMTEEDLDKLYEIYADPGVTKYTEGLYADREKEREYIRAYIQNAYTFWGFGTWVVESKMDGRLLGRVGFNLREGYVAPELGFIIASPYQRQGLAYETCLAALKAAKEEYGFTRVQALVKEENLASVRHCEKLGFMQSKKVIEAGEEYLLYEKEL